MYKDQKVQLNADRKETSKTIEAAAKKLETIQLAPKEPFPSLKKINQTSPQGTTKQVPKVLAISETINNSNLISKNNHRTPRRCIYSIILETEPEELITQNDTGSSSVIKNNRAPRKVATNNHQASKKIIPESVKVDLKETETVVRKSSQASSSSSVTEKVPTIPKIPQPDPTVCTCVGVKPAPIAVPQKETPNGPKYRWIAVKSESLKTEAENAPIPPLAPTIGPKNHSTTNTLRKPRLCPFCWNKVLEKRNVRQQKEEQRRRELMIAEQSGRKNKTKTKSGIKANRNNQINNRFGNLIYEPSA